MSLSEMIVVVAVLCFSASVLNAGPMPQDDYVMYLGSASADGKPTRRLSSSLFVAPDIIIDYGNEKNAHMGRLGLSRADISPVRINHILITHSHEDHFSAPDIVSLADERSRLGAEGKLSIYGDSTVISAMTHEMAKRSPGYDKVKLVSLKQFETCRAGDWTVKTLAADHAPDEDCLLYVLSRNSTAFLYATDTSVFPEKTFEALRGEKLDLAAVEGTWFQDNPPIPATGHMTLSKVSAVKSRLESMGVMKPNAKFALTHTNNENWGRVDYERHRAALAQMGIIQPFDGLRIDLKLNCSWSDLNATPDNTVVSLSDATVSFVGKDSIAVVLDGSPDQIGVECKSDGLKIGDRISVVGVLYNSGSDRKIGFAYTGVR